MVGSVGVVDPVRRAGIRPLVVVGGVWLGLAYLAAEADLVVRPSTEPPLRIGLAVAVPVVGVLVALAVVPRFRAWAEGLDLPLLINMQGWRVAGFAFLAVYSQGLLPGGFAWPAGVGDLVVGLAAPFVAVAVVRRGYEARRVFLGWTALGIVDFVVAVSLGMAHALTVRPASTDGMSVMAPMAEVPLSLIPTFAVPFLLIVHILALVRFARSGRERSERHGVDGLVAA